VRENNFVSLTEAGRLLEVYAQRMLKLRDEAIRSVAQLQNLKAGTLTVAAHESAALYLLPKAVLRFMRILPDIKISIRRARLDEIPGMVLDREVQIGFLKEAPAFQELESIDVHSDRMTLIASPSTRLQQIPALQSKIWMGFHSLSINFAALRKSLSFVSSAKMGFDVVWFQSYVVLRM
jgi:DNA-binding transcriptional LysR family regulator